jgi:hypothetical protein
VVLLTEWVAVRQGSVIWILVGAAASSVALLVAWRSQHRLRLPVLLALSGIFQLAWIGLDLRLHVTSIDSSVLYRQWGNALLHGHYPDAQYPPGAVLLFALDAALGGGPTRASHAFVMVPFQLACVATVWAVRGRWTPWLAAVVALWPLNAFSWEFRFDLVPTAFLALGLLFALRERWALAGALLGLGAVAKWTPALAAGVLLVWLVAGRRWRPARAHVLAFGVVALLFHLPFLIWNADGTLFSYRYFSSQGVTGESLWYLLLAPFGRATSSLQQFWLPADAPGWVDPATVVVQSVVLVALAVAAWRVRANLRSGVAIAAMAPVVFLLLNRVFSPQYLVLMLVAWAFAGALLLRSRIEQLALGIAIACATTANALVYPHTLFQHALWRFASAALFVLGLATTVAIVSRAVTSAGATELERSRSAGQAP